MTNDRPTGRDFGGGALRPHGAQILPQSQPGGPTTAVRGDTTRQPAVPQWTRAAWQIAKESCAPGHQFSLYFSIWNDKWELVKTQDDSSGKALALKESLSFSSVETLAAAIRERQRLTVAALPEASFLIIDAESTSPFTTGLGIDHPVENGFAFLTPYGVPYLAGSGVKGVLRRAAEDSLPPGQVELLFGTDNQAAETEEELQRGVLTFWDVFPLPVKAANGTRNLSIEVMTAHHTGYLQQKKSPHDSEQPTPIPFLAVPPHAAFRFVVTCQTHRIQPGVLSGPWQETVKQLFETAFAFLGFGAKTAVGYGAMEPLSQEAMQQAVQEAAKAAAKCPWLDQALKRLKTPQEPDPLFGRKLANEWKALEDTPLKESALRDIKARWGVTWDDKLKGARKEARSIYEGNA